MSLSMARRIMQVEEIVKPRQKTASKISINLHIIRKPNYIIVLLLLD